MAWESLKAGVAAVVRENNNKEITGTNLNSVLNSIINTVGANATFVGVASPNTSAINPDGPVFYIASQAGTYSSFTVDSQGNPAAVREGYITILKNIGNSLWSKSEVPFSIADSSVTTDKIADRAVTADKVASGAINASKLDNEAVTAEKIAGSAVTSNKIADRAVTTDKIGDQQVTRTKIADESVNAAKISNYAVTTDKLDDEAVTAEKIAEQAVQTEHIADDAIEADKIREYAVTRDKLSEEVTEELDHKANVNGSYERMTVGMSKNIEAPEAVSGIFTLRPTAGGAECASGVAKVQAIKGNTVVWNQLVIPDEITVSAYFATLFPANSTQFIAGIASHIYYFSAFVKTNNAEFTSFTYGLGSRQSFVGESHTAENLTTSYKKYSCIFGAVLNSGDISVRTRMQFSESSITVINQNFIDLTLMFGAGNEPSSPEAFEAWLQSTIGLQTYYPHNEGKLLAARLLGLNTVGLNQWDEDWEIGFIGTTDGANIGGYTDRIRAKNYCKAIPGSTIYGKIGTDAYLIIYFYDNDKNFLSYAYIKNTTTLVPDNCVYFRIATETYGTTYNNDICINLHYINGQDGQYKKYKKYENAFDVTKVYGKNEFGMYIQAFPAGMRSAGTVHDIIDIKERKAIVNIGIQNLADNSLLNWQKKANAEHTFYTWAIRDLIGGSEADIVTKKYIIGTTTQVYYNMTLDKAICSSGFIGINDSSISSVSDLIEALDGVFLWYAKSTPLVYTDLIYRDNGVDTPIDALNLIVDNYGTEEQVIKAPVNGDPSACAAGIDIIYGVNAADFMDAAINGAFISKASMEAFLNALGSAMGGTWAQTWNSVTGHYDYSFTQNRQIEEFSEEPQRRE